VSIPETLHGGMSYHLINQRIMLGLLDRHLCSDLSGKRILDANGICLPRSIKQRRAGQQEPRHAGSAAYLGHIAMRMAARIHCARSRLNWPSMDTSRRAASTTRHSRWHRCFELPGVARHHYWQRLDFSATGSKRIKIVI
jgi:hypothetical protein